MGEVQSALNSAGVSNSGQGSRGGEQAEEEDDEDDEDEL
jgi:hypothetical protein